MSMAPKDDHKKEVTSGGASHISTDKSTNHVREPMRFDKCRKVAEGLPKVEPLITCPPRLVERGGERERERETDTWRERESERQIASESVCV